MTIGIGVPGDAESTGGNGSLVALTKRLRTLVGNVITLLGGGLPAALGAGGGLRVDGSGTPLPVTGSVAVDTTGLATSAKQDSTNTALGTTTGTAVVTDANGTLQQYLRGLVVHFVTLLSRLPATLGAGGGLKVDGSGTALPISLASLPALATGTNTIGTARREAVDCSEDDVDEPAANTAAVVTYAAAEGLKHKITGVAWSYTGGDPTGGKLTVENGSGHTVFALGIKTGGAGFVPLPKDKRGSTNTAMIISLAAGGEGITGALSILNHETEAA